MGALIVECREAVDMVNNQARADAAFRRAISRQWGTLHGIVAGAGCRYFETSVEITADGSDSYDEEDNHLSSVRMARVLDDGTERPLDELMSQEEWLFKGKTGDAVAYTLIDDQIFLYPNPSSGTYKLYYIPQPADLSSYDDSDLVDVVTADGLQFLIWAVAVQIHGALEGNAVLALQERERAREELMVWAAARSSQQRRNVNEDYLDDYRGRPPGSW
jgi:hypothetical protein